MDDSIAQGLANKIYERRKTAAYELERAIKAEPSESRIRAIVVQLCSEFIGDSTRSSRSPSGGLIGLAATTIALGRASAKYLDLIIPAVLSCFSAQDSRVRYYSTESLYNIAKVAKGEVLLYFNEIFDALCKLSADSETSVKSGSELLDRLMKDIVSEKASSYVSVLHQQHDNFDSSTELDHNDVNASQPVYQDHQRTTAFSLARFIPLLSERLYVVNPYTRTFLVSWISVLNSIPDLDLIMSLPDFIDGLMRFLADSHQDVRVATTRLLDSFLEEIKKHVQVQETSTHPLANLDSACMEAAEDERPILETDPIPPEFDTYVDFPRLIIVLLEHLSSTEEAIQLSALRWFHEFFAICPTSLLQFIPRLLNVVLPAISHESTALRRAAREVNEKLLELIRAFMTGRLEKTAAAADRSDAPEDLDFTSAVKSATYQLSNAHEETRTAALSWLMEMHKMTSNRSNSTSPDEPLLKTKVTTEILPALLRTLSDSSENVVKKDLELLAQISKNDDYFNHLMIDLLTLFSSDRALLESRGSLIVRQLSLSLNGERIFRTLAENLEREADTEFAQSMVLQLNQVLLTSPELFDARRRLRQLASNDGSTFFVTLYKTWCHNAVATFSLCLLAQAYEQAVALLQVFGDLEITVHMLVQIDKLVQLLESPVFTYLRLQLLEPEKYPFLQKCLYGLLMLLPQTAAFHTLRNRLNSIGFMSVSGQSPSKATLSTRSKASHEPNWNDLLSRFKLVQGRRVTSVHRRPMLEK